MAEGESPPLGDGPELRRRWRASTRGGAGVGGVACRVDGAEQSEAQQGSPRSARLLLGSVLWATLSWVLIASARRARVQAEIDLILHELKTQVQIAQVQTATPLFIICIILSKPIASLVKWRL